MKETKTDRSNSIEDILRIIERLRSETGCPWDRKQTPETVQTYLVEESHEAAAAIRSGKVGEVAEELGDVLFMALFLVYLYEERGDFSLKDVCRRTSEKMVRRHPHVFGEMSVNSAEEVKDNWEKIKADEKRATGKASEPVPESLPALIRAYRVLSRISYRQDEDWNDLMKQGREFARESGELAGGLEKAGLESPDVLGSLLVRLVNIGRLKGYRAEDILHNFLRKIE
ncbi:MAG: MazG family protein [Syntrophobacteraceae bacterium]